MNKTYEEHLELMYETVRLQLFFIWHYLQRHPEESFRNVIRNRVNIYGATDIFVAEAACSHNDFDFDNPDWLAVEATCGEMFEDCRKDETAEPFEKKAFAFLKLSIEARASRTFDVVPPAIKYGYQCGSLKYDAPAPEHPDLVAFHITNAVAPKSIFADSAYLPNCFMDLFRKVEKEYGVDQFGTMTWLNTLPKWLALFPEEWHDNMQIIDSPRWSLATWGQFINARGCFNTKLGRWMRENNGELPFKIGRSRCHFNAMKQHLERFLV
jgi:hypothetical protein